MATRPKSIQTPSAYLTRNSFRFADPTGLQPDQWRMIAREPINKMAQRFIVRELCALQYNIVSDDRKDPRAEKYTDEWEDKFERGDGFDVWMARMIEDACTLSFGAASEVGYQGEDFDWIVHVDGATLMPTYEDRLPYAQINPDNWTQRVYFSRKNLARLRVAPRPDLRHKEYQVSPTEDAFLSIQALSRIYLYYMQQLDDTPPPGILDVGDMTYEDAMDWAKQFRETIEGIDPIKIPILYDHEVPAKWIPFGLSPNDLNMVEQFKRFAEMLLGKYGLSIGDLRLFEHESTKAGERVSQMVTERSGIGFWASMITAYFDRLLPKGLHFQFKQPRPERELIVAQRQQTQLAILQAATGNKALMEPADAIEQAKDWELFTVEFEAPEPEPVPPALAAGENGNQGPTQEDIDENEEARDAFDDTDLAKKAAMLVKDELGDWKEPSGSTVDRLTGAMKDYFKDVGESIPEKAIGRILEQVRALVIEDEGVEEKASLTDVVEGRVHEAFTVALDRAFQLGYLDRDERIAASSVIGDVLPTLSEALLDKVAGADAEIEDDDLRIIAKAVQAKAMTTEQIDKIIDELLDRERWWLISKSLRPKIDDVLRELYAYGLNVSAGRIEKLRLGLGETPSLSIDWNMRDPVVEKMIADHGAEMVTNVESGTKHYLRRMILEAVEEGLSTTATVERMQKDIFGLPTGEASKFTRERLVSITNYEVNKAMSGAAHQLRDSLGLKKKQWFTNRVSPCELCIANEAAGVVEKKFKYAGVFGAIFYPPAHPRTCRCVATAVEAEVRSLGTEGPIKWPFTIKAYVDAIEPAVATVS